MSIKDTNPFPKTDECIDTIGEAKCFKTLDEYSGYWQMNIHKQDGHKTDFVCLEGTL